MQVIIGGNHLTCVLVKPLVLTAIPRLTEDLLFAVRKIGNILLQGVITKGIQYLIVFVRPVFTLCMDKEFAIALEETRSNAIGGVGSVIEIAEYGAIVSDLHCLVMVGERPFIILF